MKIQHLVLSLSLLASASGQIVPDIDLAYVPVCMAALQISEFNLFDFPRFPEWFTNESVMELAQAGKYAGPVDIAEYVNFVFSPYFIDYRQDCTFSFQLTMATAEGCKYISAGVNRMELNANVTKGGEQTLDFLTAVGMSYTPKIDAASANITGLTAQDILIYYGDGFLNYLFGDRFDTPKMSDYVCNIMETSCASTFALNNLTSASCRSEFESLPLADGNHIDGLSRGCRSLHATFASVNEDHCPHLSFAPETDVNGKIKCQETKGRTPEDVFGAEYIAFIKGVGEAYGLVDGLALRNSSDYELACIEGSAGGSDPTMAPGNETMAPNATIAPTTDVTNGTSPSADSDDESSSTTWSTSGLLIFAMVAMTSVAM